MRKYIIIITILLLVFLLPFVYYQFGRTEEYISFNGKRLKVGDSFNFSPKDVKPDYSCAGDVKARLRAINADSIEISIDALEVMGGKYAPILDGPRIEIISNDTVLDVVPLCTDVSDEFLFKKDGSSYFYEIRSLGGILG